MRVLPALAQVEEIAVPRVIGLLRPTILLPAAALAGIPAHELEMILAHELAHVRRYDLWVHFLQRLAEAVLFFNPGLWYLSRRISSLREFCCDELACRATRASDGRSRLRYAEALLHVAELQLGSSPNRGEELATISALAATGRSPTELRRRVASLLGEPVREPLLMSRGGVVALTALVLLFVVAPAIRLSSADSLVGTLGTQAHPETPVQASSVIPRVEPTDSVGFRATVSGRIVLSDGSPATSKGWLYSNVKQVGHGYNSTEGEYTDRFSAAVVPGTVWLKYFPDGFAPVGIGPLELAAGQRIDDLRIVLTDGIQVMLRIRDEQGRPVPRRRCLRCRYLAAT